MTTTAHLRTGGGPVEPLDRLVTIDRDSPVPLYFQVARRMETLIESGELPEGTRLDNEFAVAAQLGLSRPTVRQALQYLMEKGLLARKRGVGTSVARAKVRRKGELTSLYEDLERAGRRPHTELLEFATVPASTAVAGALGLNVGTEVLALKRLRHADGEPLAILRNHVRSDLGVSAEGLLTGGLYQLIRDQGAEITSADQTVGARRATAVEAELLREKRGATLLTLTRVAYDELGRAVEYGEDLYRASRYSIEMSLIAG